MLACLCLNALGCAEEQAAGDFQALTSCGEGTTDAQVPETDAGASQSDAGVPLADASLPTTDASVPGPDASVELDAGATVDAGQDHPFGLAHDAPGCAACRNDACTAYQGVFDLVAACLTNPDPQFAQECIDVMDCAYANDCGFDATGAPGCFCGTADLNACQTPGNANGPCQDEFFAAARTTQLGELIGRFGDVSLPVGVAYYFLECDRDACEACTP